MFWECSAAFKNASGAFWDCLRGFVSALAFWSFFETFGRVVGVFGRFGTVFGRVGKHMGELLGG